MQEKAYKLADLFDGAYVTPDGYYVCPFKDYIPVFKREIKDLQELISIIEERGDGIYVPAHDIIDVADGLCTYDSLSPAQRFKKIIMNAINELCFAEESLGRTPKRIKLTEAGANIIEHKKVTTETFDELELSLVDLYIDKLFELREEH